MKTILYVTGLILMLITVTAGFFFCYWRSGIGGDYRMMYLDDLPKKYRELADKWRLNKDTSLDLCTDLISASFEFADTDEGYDFWESVLIADNESELPPIPETE